MKKKIIFWAIIAVLLIAFGLYLKYASFGATIVTLLVGAGGLVCGWFAKVLYDRYVKD